MLALACVAAYFAWREHRTLSELAKLIDPVPEIVDVSYVPTPTELAAMSSFVAATPAVPRRYRRMDRRTLRRGAPEQPTTYWIVRSRISVDSVFRYYRTNAPQRGWTIELDASPLLMLSRAADSLVVFASDDWPRKHIKILYAHH